METSIRLHIGKEAKHVLVNKKSTRNLRSFQLTTEPVLLTTWGYIGNGPLFEDAPDDIYTNEAYPLRFDIGEDVNSLRLILLSRPLGGLKRVEIDLHPDHKDVIRLTFIAPIHQNVVDTLIDLGVEVDMPGVPVQ